MQGNSLADVFDEACVWTLDVLVILFDVSNVVTFCIGDRWPMAGRMQMDVVVMCSTTLYVYYHICCHILLEYVFIS